MFSYKLYWQFVKLASVFTENAQFAWKYYCVHEQCNYNRELLRPTSVSCFFKSVNPMNTKPPNNVCINKIETNLYKFTFLVVVPSIETYFVGVTRRKCWHLLLFLGVFTPQCLVLDVWLLPTKHQQNLLNCNNKRQFDGNMEI